MSRFTYLPPCLKHWLTTPFERFWVHRTMYIRMNDPCIFTSDTYTCFAVSSSALLSFILDKLPYVAFLSRSLVPQGLNHFSSYFTGVRTISV